MTPGRTLATAPGSQRLGILTQPSWLVSHSDAMDNHAIHRGIWVRRTFTRRRNSGRTHHC
jgi:hypothetical protein